MPVPRTIDAIDWSLWKPQDRATLIFVIQNDRILLIRKKRGLGAGKISGPGGRIEADETPAACALRELEEELRVRALDLTACGENRVQFTDGYRLLFFVFRASGLEGTPMETEEATPIWTPLDRIPYEETWADDRAWLPLVVEATPFLGRFIFDGDKLLDQALETGPRAAAARDALTPS